MLYQQLYFLIGLVLAIFVLIAGGTGKVRVRHDGSQFALAVLVFLLWPVCIVIFVAGFIIDKIKYKFGNH